MEGWHEIPDQLAEQGGSIAMVSSLRLYYMVSVLIGGLLGLSIATAVFVDEMTADNTKRLEHMVAELHEEVQAFREEMQTLHRRP